jgi:hypothetical protein
VAKDSLLKMLRNGVLSVLITGLLLLSLLLGNRSDFTEQKLVEVREVAVQPLLANEPITPTSESSNQSQTRGAVQETAVEIADVGIEVDMSLFERVSPTVSSMSGSGLMDSQHIAKDMMQDLNFANELLSIDELDSKPLPVIWPDYDLPKSLIEQKMPDTTVTVHVVVHEDGRASLIDFENIAYEELKPVVKKIIHGMWFTKPTKAGQAVKTELILPLELEGVR